MKYIDLFAGIGGFHYGIDVAVAERNEQGVSQKGESGTVNDTGSVAVQQLTCIYSNEWDKYANSVYRRHYGECDIKDIRTVDAGNLPDFDLICGGFPCQSFSIAGKRGGFEDTRGTLFFEIVRIARAKRPRYLFFENVKGLLSHDKGNTFATIIQAIDELGYDCQWQVCNSKNFGVPQNRERVYIVGHLRGTPRPKIFPIGEDGGKVNELSGYVANTITGRYEGGQGTGTYIGEGELNAQDKSSGQGVQQEGNKSDSADGGRGETYSASPMRWVRTEKGKEYRRNAMKQGRDLTPFNSGYRELVESKEPVIGTITNALQKDALLKQDMRIRRLTPVECERLQGFPDDWTKYGADGEVISDTQRYKMCGNAVTTNVITEIIKKLI